MILLDTSIWVDHLRAADAVVAGLLRDGRVLGHAFVVGELALGHLRQRAAVLGLMLALPQARVASDAEVLHLIERRGLAGFGIGYVDAHLLAATVLTPGSVLWTRDRRLRTVAGDVGVACDAAR